MNNPDKKAMVFSALEARFTDRPLGKILEVAKKFPRLESASTKVQTEKVHSYLTSNTSPSKVFVLLALDDAGNDVLLTPLFSEWMNYVKVFNKQNPKQQESWFTPLHHYYEWLGLERIIEQALQNPSTAKIGKMVENARLKDWLDREHNPEHVFHFLYLNKAGEQTLASPKFKTWSKYLNDFNKRYPDQKTTML